MSEPNVLVNFRLDRDKPLRVRWLATDGVPGDGYKAQIIAIILKDGTRIEMDDSAIMEQTAPDAAGGIGAYMVTFNGMVGFASDHPNRGAIDKLTDEEIAYELEFVRDDFGTADDARVATEDQDFRILDQPKAMAHKLTRRDA
jgi:hypothetical protein